jgi:hypothetical protein
MKNTLAALLLAASAASAAQLSVMPASMSGMRIGGARFSQPMSSQGMLTLQSTLRTHGFHPAMRALQPLHGVMALDPNNAVHQQALGPLAERLPERYTLEQLAAAYVTAAAAAPAELAMVAEQMSAGAADPKQLSKRLEQLDQPYGVYGGRTAGMLDKVAAARGRLASAHAHAQSIASRLLRDLDRQMTALSPVSMALDEEAPAAPASPEPAAGPADAHLPQLAAQQAELGRMMEHMRAVAAGKGHALDYAPEVATQLLAAFALEPGGRTFGAYVAQVLVGPLSDALDRGGFPPGSRVAVEVGPGGRLVFGGAAPSPAAADSLLAPQQSAELRRQLELRTLLQALMDLSARTGRTLVVERSATQAILRLQAAGGGSLEDFVRRALENPLRRGLEDGSIPAGALLSLRYDEGQGRLVFVRYDGHGSGRG